MIARGFGAAAAADAARAAAVRRGPAHRRARPRRAHPRQRRRRAAPSAATPRASRQRAGARARRRLPHRRPSAARHDPPQLTYQDRRPAAVASGSAACASPGRRLRRRRGARIAVVARRRCRPGRRRRRYVPIPAPARPGARTRSTSGAATSTSSACTVNYAGTGSSDGRNQFRNGTVDFAVSEIPYGLADGRRRRPAAAARATPTCRSSPAARRSCTTSRSAASGSPTCGCPARHRQDLHRRDHHAGTTRRSRPTTPGLALPARRIVPVVRSDGSGTTAQFTHLAEQAVRRRRGTPTAARPAAARPCGVDLELPGRARAAASPRSPARSASPATWRRSQNEGAITYVEYSYALNTGFPVAKVLNAAGYYVEPTASNVAVGLLEARSTSTPAYLTQNLDGVYDNARRARLPAVSYSYMVVPTAAESGLQRREGQHARRLRLLLPLRGPAAGRRRSATRRCRSTWCRPGSTQVKRIPGVDAAERRHQEVQQPDLLRGRHEHPGAKTPRSRRRATARAPTQCATGTGGARTTTPVNTGPKQPNTAPNGGNTPKTGPTTTGPSTAPTTGPLVRDPDTGELVPAGGDTTGGEVVNGVPVALEAEGGWGLSRALMLIAGVLLAALVVGPPLLAHALRRKAP